MKKSIIFAIGLVLGTLAFGYVAHAQSIPSQSPFWVSGSNITPIPLNAALGLKIPSLASENCLGTDSTGVFEAGTCSGGGGSTFGTTSLSAVAPLQYSQSPLAQFSITQAGVSTNGYLSSTDWNTFNNKQPSGTYVTSVSGTANQINSSGSTAITLSLPNHVIFPIDYVASAGSTTNATTTNFAIVGSASNCGGTSALTTNSSGVVGCTTQPQGTVTAVSVASTNGFAGSSSGGATPSLTLSTTISGLLKGNGTAISAATPGTDYDVFAWPFTPINATSVATSSGLVITASSTIGNGTQATGLFISGGSTTTLSSLIQGSLTIGTTTSNAANKLLTVEGNTSGGIVRFQRDFSATPATSSLGTFDTLLNETGAAALANLSGPTQTFGISLAGGAENILADIGAYRFGADNTGELIFRPYSAGTALQSFFISPIGASAGSSTPFATFAIHANNGTTNTTLFAIGSSTASATTTLFSVTNIGSTTLASTFGPCSGSTALNTNSGGTIICGTVAGSNSAFSPSANYATATALPSNTYLAGVITAVANGALSVDGASPSVGQRVLVKNEATAANNGLYDVTAAGSAIAVFVLTRDAQYNSSSNIIPGIVTYVISGSTNDDDFWAMTSAAPITVGTTALNYTEVSGGGAGVASVSNSDSSLTFSPTTGAVVGSLNINHSNIWTALQVFNASVGVGSSTPFSALSVGTGAASSSITVAEYKYGKSGNVATSTAQNIDCNASTQIAEPIGTSATTLTLINMTPGKKCIVVVQNPGAAAGAITWAVQSNAILKWAGGTVPTQTLTANAMDIWSFLATQGSSTMQINGAQSANF